ncbi:MAG: translocation/assembly module TamB domain-containing protein, partial [Bacteroidota bacterium]
MAKILKISGRIFGLLVEWLLILLTVFAFAIRTSPVQTYLARLATEFLSKELHTTIRIDAVSIVFIDQIALDGIFILDQKQDTLADIKRIYIGINELDLNKRKLGFSKAEIEKGNIHISRDSLTGDFNYWFLTDYFSSSEVSEEKKEPFEVTLTELALEGIQFRYDDFTKGYSSRGMDFDHLKVNDLSLVARNFKQSKEDFTFRLAALSATEQCGFVIKRLNSDVAIGSSGIRLDGLYLGTSRSELVADRLYLLYDDPDDFQHFTDSVSFDVLLKPSRLSMADVAIFATALHGMNEVVRLEGAISDPVNRLKISDLNLQIGKKTQLKGDFRLPDFRDLKNQTFSQRIQYAYVDLEDLKKIRLPESSAQKHLTFDKFLDRLGYFKARDLKFDGSYQQFALAADQITTRLGTVRMGNGILFTNDLRNRTLYFDRSAASTYDVKLENFNLGGLLDNRDFGIVDGTFFLAGEAKSNAAIKFNSIEGNVNRFDYLNYAYRNITIAKGSLVDNVLNAVVDVRDDNLNLLYDGFIDFNGDQHMKFSIDLTEALLTNLNISASNSSKLKTNFNVDIKGKDPNTMSGTVNFDGIVYQEGDKVIALNAIELKVERSLYEDRFIVRSEVGDFALKGKVDFSTIVSDFTYQFEKVFPGLINNVSTLSKKPIKRNPSVFSYDLTVKDADDFLAIFAPDLSISAGTNLSGNYDGKLENFTMKLNSQEVSYLDFVFHDVAVDQKLTSQNIIADYKVKAFNYGDSIKLDNLLFQTTGERNVLVSELVWNPETSNESDIQWTTTIVDNSQINIQLQPSYFSINEMRWDVEKQSDMQITKSDIHIGKFRLSRDKQFISLDGCISRNDADKLNLRINELDLNEVAALLGLGIKLEGTASGWGYLSNPYTDLTYMGDASILGLFVNDQEVGDVFVQSQWNKASESVGIMGDLMYRGNQTFEFAGNYFTERETDNLDLSLLFDHTDIQFTNAFLDPDVISNIRGELNGSLSVSGTPDFPKLEGRVNLQGGNAKIEMLGVNFGFDGQIISDEYGFYINNMPVSDEEGNTGSLIGSVYHEQYQDWNFDLQVDLEGRGNVSENPFFSWAPSYELPERFLVMNTSYKEGVAYYGKAYGTGSVNIFGSANNLDITVDLKTHRGTRINFPMYGVSEISEENDFVRFLDKLTTINIPEPKIDYTGVELDLNFRVTPEAKLRIVFNEELGDEINASGSGDISMKMDNLGDLKLEGTYRLGKEGVYNFAMGPIKQPFYIQEGGTITWTGDPYNANVNLRTFYKVNASLAEISPDELQGTANVNNQEILCYLVLTESLF